MLFFFPQNDNANSIQQFSTWEDINYFRGGVLHDFNACLTGMACLLLYPEIQTFPSAEPGTGQCFYITPITFYASVNLNGSVPMSYLRIEAVSGLDLNFCEGWFFSCHAIVILMSTYIPFLYFLFFVSWFLSIPSRNERLWYPEHENISPTFWNGWLPPSQLVWNSWPYKQCLMKLRLVMH